MEVHTNNLNLDINLNELLGQWIDLDETRVDGAIKSPEFRDQAHITLAHWPVWIGAADATGNGTKSTNDGAEGIDWAQHLALTFSEGGNHEGELTHRPIPAMGGSILAFALKRLRIRWLQVLATRRLNTNCAADLIVAVIAVAIKANWSFAILHGAGGGRHVQVVCFCAGYYEARAESAQYMK